MKLKEFYWKAALLVLTGAAGAPVTGLLMTLISISCRRFFTDPSDHRGVATLLQLQVCRQIGPDDIRGVVALPQLGAPLEDKVDDEELYTSVHA